MTSRRPNSAVVEYLIPGDNFVKLIRVPDLRGWTLSRVKPALDQVSLSESHDGEVDENLDVVVAQDPEPGFQAAPKLSSYAWRCPFPTSPNAAIGPQSIF